MPLLILMVIALSHVIDQEVLLSLEVAATLLLLGAQVIAEYERIEIDEAPKEAVPMRAEPL